MTIASEIQRINTNIANAYTAARQKSAVIPPVENSANLAQTISSITTGGGGNPSEVCKYTIFNGGIGPATKNLTGLFDSITSINGPAMSYAFTDTNCYGDVSFPSLTTTPRKAFVACFEGSAIESADFSALTTAGERSFEECFSGCEDMTSVDFSSLTDTGNSPQAFNIAFEECTSLESADFSSLTAISSPRMFIEAFIVCESLTTCPLAHVSHVASYGMKGTFAESGIEEVTFTNLHNLDVSAMEECFMDCPNLTKVNFPNLTGANATSLQNCFSGCDALTEIHFKTGTESLIQGLIGYSDNFGATNAIISFDL